MTDSALGESTVTSPVIGHTGPNVRDVDAQMLSPNCDRGTIWTWLLTNINIDILNIITAASFSQALRISIYVTTGAMNDNLVPNKSQCSSLGSDREENFESYGENDDIGIDADDK